MNHPVKCVEQERIYVPPLRTCHSSSFVSVCFPGLLSSCTVLVFLITNHSLSEGEKKNRKLICNRMEFVEAASDTSY